MRRFFFTSLYGLLILLPVSPAQSQAPEDYLQNTLCQDDGNFTLLIHGGVTYRDRPDRHKARQVYINDILIVGNEALKSGVSSLDVISYALASMENSGIFNAGSGSIPNQTGYREMDASIMHGQDKSAGAIASVLTAKNPILAARYVMENTKNVFFVGKSADDFLSGKITRADLARPAQNYAMKNNTPSQSFLDLEHLPIDPPHGTIGAVALDRCGNLSAGTSTGGFGSKIPGRVGDSPVIGAGTYADKNVAVSASGHGEYFIRHAIAHDISARIKYGGASLQEAAQGAIKELSLDGGTGGVITLGNNGEIFVAKNTFGFIHGFIGSRYPEPITSGGNE